VARMRALDACFGGEGNGGVIDPTVHLGRDAGVAVALLLALEVSAPAGRGGLAAAARELPPSVLLKETVALPAACLDALAADLEARLGKAASRADGWRWAWEARWLHLRPSNTEPIVRVVAEAGEAEAARELVAFVASRAARVAADRAKDEGTQGKEGKG